MEILRNIMHMLGGLIAVSFFLFSNDMPGILMEYRWPIIGAYLVLLGATEFFLRRGGR